MHTLEVVGWVCTVVGVLAIGTLQLGLIRGRLPYGPKIVTAEILAALLSTVGLMLAMAF